MSGLVSQESGGAPASKDIIITNPDIKELHDLLTNQTWQERFVIVQTIPQQEAIDSRQKEITQLAKKSAGVRLREEISTPGPKEFRGERYQQLFEEEKQKELTGATDQIQDLTEKLNTARQENILAAKTLIQEVEIRKDDPKLITALEVWGRSPNHANERGVDGRGLNAGVIHFFEYRAFQDKSGHNRESLSLDNFITRSQALAALMTNPHHAATLEDENGKQAFTLLTASGELIIAYKEANQPSFTIVTVIPGQNESALQRRIKEEIETPVEKKSKRLNYLGGHVRQLQV